MADAIISPLLDRLLAFITQQIHNQVNLVRGMEEQIRDLSDQLRTIRTVLDDAERKGFKDKSVRDWLKRLETACYEMDDVLDEWDYNILGQRMEKQSKSSAALKHKVCSFVSSPSACLSFDKVSFHRGIGKKIKQVKLKLDRILEEKGRYSFTTGQPADPFGGSWRVQSTSFVQVENVCGRNDDKDILMSKLLQNDFGEETSGGGVQVLSIVGVGGIGKTTLAQLVYNESRVKECYPLRTWICVSDPFDPAMIATWIVQKAEGTSHNMNNQLDKLLEHLREAIQGKKFLFVLDDVWTDDSAKWEPLKICLNFGAPGSKVLVTTRNERVARMMGTTEKGIHRPKVLSDDHCWLLLSRIAFLDRSENECQILEKTGRKIADRCNGLPLAAKVMGSLLRFKHGLEDWESVLDSEMWELEEAEVDIFPHLLLTYNELTPALKRCFSYCAIFPKDHKIDVEKDLIQNWLALGYLGSDDTTTDLELRGREWFRNLAMRSLFKELHGTGFRQNSTIFSCKMHDIVHDFAQYIRNNSSSSGRIQKTCQVCHSTVSHVKEYHSLSELGHVPYMCECLISLKVLHLEYSYLITVPKDIDKLIHLRHLGLFYLREDTPAQDIKLICKLYNLKSLILCSCNIEEIPMEIRNLIGLRSLDLSWNLGLKELPERIGDLRELRSLYILGCTGLSGLPQGMHKLTKLKHLDITHAFSDSEYPDEVIGQLSGLQTLIGFRGSLTFLKKLNQLKQIQLGNFSNLTVLPPLGELPCLERLEVSYFSKLEFVGRKFLGITTKKSSAAASVAIGFPKLEILIFRSCRMWKEWEDITAEEEASTVLSLFPCLKLLSFHNCDNINTLPHRLLRKAPALEELWICGCPDLERSYDKSRHDSYWKYISHIPIVHIPA